MANVGIPVQVGGGLRDDDAVDAMLAAGAARVIVGTRAVEDDTWRRRIAQRHPGRVVVAADVRDGRVVTRGWQAATSHESTPFLQSLNEDPLAAVLVTDVTREGQMLGINQELFAGLAGVAAHPLIAAGGIRDAADLRLLAHAGVAGAVLGMALYRGTMDIADVTREFVA
jgi:phosphoribosylformimino-5-aminoimidazole carboxamide ribotide isomerase